MLLENMSDEYLREIALYFSALQFPYPDPERIQMQSEEIKLARRPIYSACQGNRADFLRVLDVDRNKDGDV